MLLALLVAAPSAGRDCAVPDEAQSCTTNDECGCGNMVDGEGCTVAAPECVFVTSSCGRFCGGGGVAPVCRGGRCVRDVPTRCAGDCDADAAVGIAELMVGVGVALDLHPLAACSNLDADGDVAVGINELLRAVRAGLEGCAAAVVPDPALRGIYDGQVSVPGGRYEAVAQVRQTDEELSLIIWDRPNASLTMSGPLMGQQLTLTGSYFQTDYGSQVDSDAILSVEGDAEIISGAIESRSSEFGVPDGFRLSRVISDDPARFSTTATVAFSASPCGNGQRSHAVISIDVASDGTAFLAGGEDRGLTDGLYGTVTSGTCLVAPGGHLYCSAHYLVAESGLAILLRFTGLLQPNGGGEGAFLSGIDPPFFDEPYVYGAWSAERD